MTSDKPIVVHAEEYEDIRTTCRIVLQDRYDYRGFEDGVPALAELQRLHDAGKKPEFILSDGGMPEMRGDQFVREARRLFPDVPIVITSGVSHDYKDVAREVKAANIGKPFNPVELAEGVASAKAMLAVEQALDSTSLTTSGIPGVPGVPGNTGQGLGTYTAHTPPQGHHRPANWTIKRE